MSTEVTARPTAAQYRRALEKLVDALGRMNKRENLSLNVRDALTEAEQLLELARKPAPPNIRDEWQDRP